MLGWHCFPVPATVPLIASRMRTAICSLDSDSRLSAVARSERSRSALSILVVTAAIALSIADMRLVMIVSVPGGWVASGIPKGVQTVWCACVEVSRCSQRRRLRTGDRLNGEVVRAESKKADSCWPDVFFWQLRHIARRRPLLARPLRTIVPTAAHFGQVKPCRTELNLVRNGDIGAALRRPPRRVAGRSWTVWFVPSSVWKSGCGKLMRRDAILLR